MAQQLKKTQNGDHARPPIAVIGVSALFPGSIDSTGFWSDILDGTDRMTDVPSTHWLVDDHYDADLKATDKTYGRRGGFLETVELEAMEFGIPPTTVPSTDTSQLLALIVAQRVLDDATSGQFSELDRERTSVILGVTSGQELLGAMASRMSRPIWLQGMRRAGVPEDVALAACDKISDLHPQWTENTFPGLLGNVVAGRIANRLNLGGTNCVTDAACASSFSALSMAANELYLGDSDLVIAGGVDTMNDIFMYMCFSKTPALSQSEDIRPFSDKADGTMLGEGIGMVALKRLDDAERDGNRIYCVLNGVGSSSDGNSKSIYAPVSTGQARALTNTYAKTSYGPESVELVEAHGTGTVAGDAAEFGGLELAFGASGRQDHQWCALGSVKGQIGHTKAAAGAAGLFKVIMALHHKVLPQTIKIDQPNPNLDLPNSPFYLNTRTRPWVRGSDHERRGSVSSFGFGGSNFHVALSEYTGSGAKVPRLRPRQSELVVLCGSDADDVIAQAIQHRDAAQTDGYLLWLAQTSQRSYDASAAARLSVVANDEEELKSKLDEAIALIEKTPTAAFSTPGQTHFGVGEAAGAVGFLFPGQGSQYLFMGTDLAINYDRGIAPWDLAADLDWSDKALHEIVFPPRSFDEDTDAKQLARLTETQWAQPAIGATSLALLGMLKSIGVQPAQVGGHSFGEIVALHAAGVLTESDALKVAVRRGELMAEAAKVPGAMTAVARPIDEVRSLVEASGVDVVIANHNTPTQVVLSGPTSSIEVIEGVLSEEGITAKRLPVTTAFHSPVVSGASGAFGEFLQDIAFESPAIPVLANQTAAPYPDDPAEMRAQLGRQLANSVRFVDMIEAMHYDGIRVFVEVGPASVLTGLVRTILKGREFTVVTLDKKNKSGLGAFLGGIGHLAASGISMDLGPLWDEYASASHPDERAKPKLTIGISGANYGAPYPPQDLDELVGPNANSTSANSTSANSAMTNGISANGTMTNGPSASAPTTVLSESSPRPVAAAPTTPTPMRSAIPLTQPDPLRPSAPPISSGVLHAYEVVQQQTAQAHAEYMATMAQVHTAFLQTSQQSIAILGALAGGTASAVPMDIATVPVATAPVAALPVVMTAPPIATPPVVMATPPVAAPPVVIAPRAVVEPSPAPVAAVPAAVAPVAGLSADELEDLVLRVVASTTGYPPEMLTMEMELESDLGIDSIKRVEIMSLVQDDLPSLPETTVMAGLATLGQIVDYLASHFEESLSASPPPGEDPSNATSEADIGRFTLEAITAPKAGAPATGLSDGTVVVTDEGGGIAAALVDTLVNNGIDATVVDRVPPSEISSVIFLGGLRDISSVEEAVAINREAFNAARSFKAANDTGGLFVTVSDLGGDFGLGGSVGSNGHSLSAWTGGLSGLTKTAAIEWPSTTVRAIDVDRAGRDPGVVGAAIANELLGGGCELEIGLGADGERVTLRSTPVAVEQGLQPIGPEDVIIVSGGARGVTAAAMVKLADATKATFVLLGRSVLVDELAETIGALDDTSLKRALLSAATASGVAITPTELSSQASKILANREIKRTIAAIESTGGRARYVPVDITSADSVVQELAKVRAEFGPITGVVHGAGVLADKLIIDKTDAQFDSVFNPKVEGLRVLLESTESDPLKLLCLFSSVAARTGNNGQADYAMANEILNKVAAAERVRRGDSCVVKSLGWGPWDGGMVSPALKSHFASMGVCLIPLDEGARMLVDEIASPQLADVELVMGGGVLPDGSAGHITT